MRTYTFEGTTELKNLLELVDRLKAEIDALRPLSPEQEARVMQKFRLDWNYHSNAIEGNSLTYGETIAFLMEGLTAKGKPFKDHLDIKGHNEAIDYLMALVKNRSELSEKTIRELHSITLVEAYSNPARTLDGQIVEKRVNLGAYKTMPNHVKTRTGETHYYATPEETPAKMADLVAWLRDHQQKQDIHPLIIAAIFHYRFVAIHPFDDGNGRMSRLLMNLLLMQDAYPPVVIRKQAREGYYYALRQADAGDLEPFVTFIGENLLHSMDLYLRGARGESIEDQDDLRKEISLLKAGLPKEAVVKTGRSSEALKNVYKEVLVPFFSRLILDSADFNDLFSSNQVTLKVIQLDGGTYPLNMPEKNLEKSFDGIYEWDKFQIISLGLLWVGFNRSRNIFGLNRWVEVTFRDFDYIIQENMSLTANTRIEKLYDEVVTEMERKSWSDAIIRGIISEIKSKTT